MGLTVLLSYDVTGHSLIRQSQHQSGFITPILVISADSYLSVIDYIPCVHGPVELLLKHSRVQTGAAVCKNLATPHNDRVASTASLCENKVDRTAVSTCLNLQLLYHKSFCANNYLDSNIKCWNPLI